VGCRCRGFLMWNALSNRVPRALVSQLMALQPTNERIEHLRGQARRARRLAATLSGDADRLRLISHAEELEETAAQLERQAHGKPRGKS
jgi:phosphopantetheinyl transferase